MASYAGEKHRYHPINITWLSASDYEEAQRICDTCLPHQANLKDYRFSNKYVILGNKIGGNLCGVMVYYLPDKTSYLLHTLCTRPEYRRTGVASELVESVRRKMGPKLRKRMDVWVDENNLPAQKLFSSLGFFAFEQEKGKILFQWFA